eukprot:TRINITY_DN2569_c0_g1_i2.p1 TRINITY_DN2569_c0_g1~~TRINITY_DN2569_c0_g1_i2.p1  ORF type:complete len:522 (-),score=54.06 TRINITY_DN2569_c0_g1_i2:300-1703(-)
MLMRERIIDSGVRPDGRELSDIRPITCSCGILPRAHGSAIFTRGETQALSSTTLGQSSSAQRAETLASSADEDLQHFYLQYYFPPCSVGEVGRVGIAGRREIGHGYLAQRALLPTVPDREIYPYTIRVESTITESNGSSSMASVCAGCLAMMDAGVPIKQPVAGVAMGLILKDDKNFVILSDILGLEDHLGDMDFKVAGDSERITAFQMDVKVQGITIEIMAQALSQARKSRKLILDKMDGCWPPPQREHSQYADLLHVMKIPVDNLGAVIGLGGKNIRRLEELTGTTVRVMSESGKIEITSKSSQSLKQAIRNINTMINTPVVGEEFRQVPVVRVQTYGASVELAPGVEGTIHISELGEDISSVQDFVQQNPYIDAMVIDIMEGGRVQMSRKAILMKDRMVGLQSKLQAVESRLPDILPGLQLESDTNEKVKVAESNEHNSLEETPKKESQRSKQKTSTRKKRRNV